MLGIEFFYLHLGIEYSKIRCRITTRSGGPLPSAVVGSQVVVQKLFSEVSFSPSPVNQQMFCQEACRYHADTIVHKSRFVKLPHSGINQRIPGFAVAPCFKFAWIIYPFNSVVGWLKAMIYYVWKMPENHLIKLSPNKLV